MNANELPADILSKIKLHELYSEGKKIVVSRGSENCKLMFIGEAPGQNENNVGSPFVGRAGKLLDYWIKETNISEYVITNIVPLIPLNEQGQIRKPTAKEISDFKFFIDYIISHYKPQKIVLLGSTATEGILGKKISEVLDKKCTYNDVPVTAVYHPAYYLRRGISGLDDFKNAYNKID